MALSSCPTPTEEMLEFNESFDLLQPWSTVRLLAVQFATRLYLSLNYEDTTAARERYRRVDAAWRLERAREGPMDPTA